MSAAGDRLAGRNAALHFFSVLADGTLAASQDVPGFNQGCSRSGASTAARAPIGRSSGTPMSA